MTIKDMMLGFTAAVVGVACAVGGIVLNSPDETVRPDVVPVVTTEPVRSATPVRKVTSAKPKSTGTKRVLRKKSRAPKPRSIYYADCSAVRAAGADPIRRGDPGYSLKLDREGDGIGCE